MPELGLFGSMRGVPGNGHPYRDQHFSGERYFQHRMPIDPSSMTRWRKRLGDAGAEQMLRVTIETGISMRAIRPAELKRINVDTTVQTGVPGDRSSSLGWRPGSPATGLRRWGGDQGYSFSHRCTTLSAHAGTAGEGSAC